ncbi:hypothetical protein KY310_02955, partial [Candidatus Woesearchaeota archaeon]|nr:hypothetical protein [Candidatus Woesearchaeota archaeon]
KDEETILLRKAREDIPEATSLVEIIDNEKQTILSIKVGSNDRETIQKIVKTWSHAEHRYVEPGESLPRFGIEKVNSYQVICDALLKLNSPVLYRKAEHESKDGYPIDATALQTIVEAAKKEVFANLRLAGCTSSYTVVSYDEEGKPIQDMAYTAVTVEFNRDPWEPPVVEPPSLPRNVFQKICSLFTRK